MGYVGSDKRGDHGPYLWTRTFCMGPGTLTVISDCPYFRLSRKVSGIALPTSFFPPILGLHLLHMEVPRLGVELELQLPAYTTATAMQDP